ncbi:hypothetical protein STSP2_01776 [Anaerohalosphaera lusitana]|uniref:Uncharacterized protein n=1 Tax=Anaerohalosphaera lusitana TaxID=1936003 RepID=A0A1U9NLI9_9BACT|nr:hypothetical protein [Anaerohalosphaera lusitana]AQT68608.1 hypothetical protein STSP2_01776 [Anaerohalosphaera lusitana]
MKIKLDFLEQYVEKIAIGIAAVICLAILWFFVIQSPKGEIRGQKLGPGKIDEYVKNQAERLEDKLARDPEPKEYTPKIEVFEERFAQSVDMSTTSVFPLPGKGAQVVAEDRIYQMPAMPQLADAKAENIRTVVFMPTEEVDQEHPYAEVPTDYADIDLVTVQADFDVQTLYREFEEKFNGPAVQRQWRDPSLAKPVFAAVKLERQKLNYGAWTEWEEVPFTKVNDYKDALKIPADVKEIPYGGVDLLRVKLGLDEIQKTIIQPFAYDIATPREEWFPPEWHERAEEYWQEERELERREDREQSRQRERARRNNAGGPGGMMPGMFGPGMDPGAQNRNRRAQRRDQEEESIDDIREAFDEVVIEEFDKLGNQSEPLKVWAFDDTVKPGNTYRYRLKIGVLNPIAGKNWFASGQKDLQDDVILWSDYSNATDTVKLEPMVHIFPTEVAESRNAASMEVAKFYYGNWRVKEFEAAVGEPIGAVVAIEEDEDQATAGMGLYGAQYQVDEIDYTTGNVLVDVATTTNWTSSSAIRSSDCDEIMFADSEGKMSHLAVGRRNWPGEMRSLYNEITNLASDEFQLFNSRDESARRKGRERRNTPQQGPGNLPGMFPPGMFGPGGG